jgi:hypothetical protein
MAFHPGTVSKRRSNPQSMQVHHGRIPAPIKGIDSRSPIAQMSELNCLYCFNIVPSENGLKVRKGYREHQIGLDQGSSLGVRTIIVYTGLDPGPLDDKLFAVTNEGILDVTVAGDAPILKYSFPDITGNAGYGVFITYTDQSGADFIYYADSVNGLHTYTASTDTWAPATGITGPDLTKVVFIMAHKQRVWMIEEGKTEAWYLLPNSIQGVATKFYFGSKLPHGGRLEALINWSVDGGGGLDDILVAVSSAGDVIPYQGSDPEATDDGNSVKPWSSIGTYFIGRVPVGRRFFSEYAGNLYLLSAYGLNSMADLLRGVDPKDISANSLTYPVADLIRRRLAISADTIGWQPIFLPNQGSLVISSPELEGSNTYLQYIMSLATQGWGIWRDVPILCFDEWRGVSYFGSVENNVYSMNSNKDNVKLSSLEPDPAGVAIRFSILTAYTDGGDPCNFKMVQYVRPDFLASITPSIVTQVYYDYDIGEFTKSPISELAPFGEWDVGLWDSAVWSGGVQGISITEGSMGIGRTVAIAMQGESKDETSLMSFDIIWKTGGLL